MGCGKVRSKKHVGWEQNAKLKSDPPFHTQHRKTTWDLTCETNANGTRPKAGNTAYHIKYVEI